MVYCICVSGAKCTFGCSFNTRPVVLQMFTDVAETFSHGTIFVPHTEESRPTEFLVLFFSTGHSVIRKFRLQQFFFPHPYKHRLLVFLRTKLFRFTKTVIMALQATISHITQK